MSKLIILLVIAFVIVNTSHGSPVTPAPTTCDVNEVYLPQGKAPNCDTVCNTLGEICNVNFIWAPFGCYCVEGYARDGNNKCIQIKQCPPKNPNPCNSC